MEHLPKKMLSWKFYEYEHRERSRDWFWALGIIAIAGFVACFLFENYLFGIFILLAAGCLALLAKRKPLLVEILITDEGIGIEHHNYPWHAISHFWIERNQDGSMTFLFHCDRFLAPIWAVPMHGVARDELRNLLLPHIKEQKIEESRAGKIMELLGF